MKDSDMSIGEIELAIRGALSWIEPPFVNENTDEQELRYRIQFCLDDANRAFRTLHKDTTNEQ